MKQDDKTNETDMVAQLAESLWTAYGFARMHPEGFTTRPDWVQTQYRGEARRVIAELQKRGVTLSLSASIKSFEDDFQAGCNIPRL